MDTDQIKGKLQNAFGKAEELIGEAVGSKNLSQAGAEDRLKGATTETWGNVKDTASNIGSTAEHNASVHANDASAHGNSLRDRIVTGAEDFKDNVNAKLDHLKDESRASRD